MVRWNRNGNWFLSGSRDQHLKLWDLRALDEPIRDYACENKGVTSIAWHPVHEDMWVSGGMDGINDNSAFSQPTTQPHLSPRTTAAAASGAPLSLWPSPAPSASTTSPSTSATTTPPAPRTASARRPA